MPNNDADFTSAIQYYNDTTNYLSSPVGYSAHKTLGKINDSTKNKIANWNMSRVTNLSNAFYGAISFNEDISGWDVSSVSDASNMFKGAENFNQNISGWNVINVVTMNDTINDATYFN